MKKSFFMFTLTLALLLLLTSCNMQIIGDFSYSHIYLETYKTEGQCYDITNWTDSNTGIEVKTKEHGTLFLSEGTYILVGDSDKCPFCSEVKE